MFDIRMKNWIIIIAAAIVWAATMVYGLLTYSNEVNSRLYADDYIRLFIPRDAINVEDEGAYGGFGPDGDRRAVYEIPDGSSGEFVKTLQADHLWNPLPLPPDLTVGVDDLTLPVSGKAGYYFFHDFQPEWYPDYSDLHKPVFERSSVNFIVIAFTLKDRRLYVYKLDT
jgi:hypothetical protein